MMELEVAAGDAASGVSESTIVHFLGEYTQIPNVVAPRTQDAIRRVCVTKCLGLWRSPMIAFFTLPGTNILKKAQAVLPKETQNFSSAALEAPDLNAVSLGKEHMLTAAEAIVWDELGLGHPLNKLMTTAWGGLRDPDLVAALRARSFAYCA